MPEPTSPYPAATCVDCQTWLGLPGMSVARVADVGTEGLVVHIESVPGPVGCPHCGVMATGHGRDEVVLVDAPSFGRLVRLVWAKRRHVCREDLCPGGSFTEQDPAVAPPRGRLTTRAVSWAVDELRGEHASVGGLARRLGVDWHTLWRAVRTHLEVLEADPARFDGVSMLGVDDSPARYRSKREVPPACGTTSIRARVARGCSPAWST